MNFLTNSKLFAEQNFHNRSVSMLNSIQMYEETNLKNQMKEVALGSLNKVINQLDDPATAAEIKKASFQSALNGIRSGKMSYEGDLIQPMIEKEMLERLQKFQGLTKEEEIELLQISPEQRGALALADKRIKNEYLLAPPQITHGSVKAHQKYKTYMRQAAEEVK